MYLEAGHTVCGIKSERYEGGNLIYILVYDCFFFFRDKKSNPVFSISNIKLFTDDVGRALEEKLSKSGYPGKAAFIKCDVTKADDVKVRKKSIIHSNFLHSDYVYFCILFIKRSVCFVCFSQIYFCLKNISSGRKSADPASFFQEGGGVQI